MEQKQILNTRGHIEGVGYQTEYRVHLGYRVQKGTIIIDTKLVSSLVAKILEKKVAKNIRETCEKAMFTPSNPNKATYKSYCYCLAIRMLPNRQ